jgi:hypothetical protein
MSRVLWAMGFSQVFRVYDNRLVYTDRRPDVYVELGLGWKICELLDENEKPLLGLGERMDGSNDRGWLWEFRGGCWVYMTPYVVGCHTAHAPREFIPVVKHLLELHQRGLVHGDIRCCNIAFNSDGTGGLIDVDFGGKINNATYPSGYKFKDVQDGYRRGKVGGTITMRDDWFALDSVMFRFHDILEPGEETGRSARRELQVADGAGAEPCPVASTASNNSRLRREMDRLRKFAKKKTPDDLSEIVEHARALEEFFADADKLGWTVEPEPELVETLTSWGLGVSRPNAAPAGLAAESRVQRTGSAPATGSPSKDK